MKVTFSRGGEQWNVPHPNICPSINRYVNVYILLLSPILMFTLIILTMVHQQQHYILLVVLDISSWKCTFYSTFINVKENSKLYQKHILFVRIIETKCVGYWVLTNIIFSLFQNLWIVRSALKKSKNFVEGVLK